MGDHHIVISADSHCGADLRNYKPYLEKKYHAEFEDWAAFMESEEQQRKDLFKDMDRSPLEVGVDGDPDVYGYRNHSSEQRLREQEEDGVIAAVLFPNTQPPFAPPASTAFEAPPYSDNFERRWAGLRAHNRWLADFVSEAPERRAGIFQIFLGDVEGSVREIEWAADQGLRGGVLVPGAPPDSPFEPLYAAQYQPIWAAAADHRLPLNHHTGGATPNFGNHFPASLAMFMLEATWWTQRGLWHLMFSGVFERHPELVFVTTETGTAWVPETLEKLDSFYHRMKYGKYGSEAVFGGQAVAEMSLTPSEYFARQCYVGASFLRPVEVPLARDVGVDRVMWGSDYPHIEGSYPHTREHLRLTFAQMTEEETAKILTTNAAKIYDFDLNALAPLAERHCPTKEFVATPIDYSEIPERGQGLPWHEPAEPGGGRGILGWTGSREPHFCGSLVQVAEPVYCRSRYYQGSKGNGGALPRSGEQAKRRLIRAGEKLFARNGIDATTIAAITKEAGQRNNYAVGWHFGGKDELIQAILDKHQPKIDDARLALLAEHDGTSLVSFEDLARALVEPLADRLRDPSGGADYLRIQAQLAHHKVVYIPDNRPPGLAKLLQLCEPYYSTGFGPDFTHEALLIFVVVFHGLSGFAALNPKPTPADLEHFTNLLVKNIDRDDGARLGSGASIADNLKQTLLVWRLSGDNVSENTYFGESARDNHQGRSSNCPSR